MYPFAKSRCISKRVVHFDFCSCVHVNVYVASSFIVHGVLNMCTSKAVMSHNASVWPCMQCTSSCHIKHLKQTYHQRHDLCILYHSRTFQHACKEHTSGVCTLYMNVLVSLGGLA